MCDNTGVDPRLAAADSQDRQNSLTPPRAPVVAVVVAAYNAGGAVARAVASALAEPQTAEVWVVDDASSDDTLERARAADDGSGRLRLLRQPRNAGPAAARNRALDALSADWICVLDSDDYFLPGRLERLLAAAEGWDLVADALIPVQADEPPPTRPAYDPGPAEPLGFAAFVEGNISRPGRHRRELGFMKPLMRRAFLEAHGLRYAEAMRLGEDYELYARLLAAGARLRFVGPAGYVAVERPGSLSGRHAIADLEALRRADDGLGRLPGLSPADRAAVRAHAASVEERLQWRRLIEAVKRRDGAMALSTVTSPRIGLHLARALLDQAWIRTARRLRRALGRPGSDASSPSTTPGA